MKTIYEVCFSNVILQIAKDMVFGWCVKGEIEGTGFEPVAYMSIAKLKVLDESTFPEFLPAEFKQAVSKSLSDARLKAAATVSQAALNAKYVPSESTASRVENFIATKKSESGEARSAVVDSWLAIYKLIFEKLSDCGVGGIYKADLGYCHVLREPSGKCHVVNVNSPEKSKEFENIQEAVHHIARTWW